MEPSRPRITGKDYSVHNPVKARLGLRLWTESLIRALPKQPEELTSEIAKPE